MYFLEAPDETLGAFKAVWAGIGDSIVVVGGDGLWNCHIHTDDIGAAIEAALDVGRPRDIRVTDLLDQVEEESWVRRASRACRPAAEPRGACAGHLGRRCGDGRRDPPHLLLARCPPHRGRGPVDEPVHRADPRGRRVSSGRRGRDPAQQQEHRARRRAGARAFAKTDVFVVATPGIQEGFARSARVRPRGERRGEREPPCGPPRAGYAPGR